MAGAPATKRIMRLVVFLLGTVGVVFLVLLLAKRFPNREGFQSAGDCDLYKSRCPGQTIGGQYVYMCASDTDATNLLQCSPDLATVLNLNTTGISNLGIRDAVCYLVPGGSYNLGSKVNDVYYVCYQRPPRLTYDDTLGTEVYENPGFEIDVDPNPATMSFNLETACGTYQGAGQMIGNSMFKTYNNIDYVSTAISSIEGAYSVVDATIKRRCTGTLTTAQSNACTGLSNFGTLQADSNYTDLRSIYTVLTDSYGKMKSLFTGDTVPKFDGLNCRPLSQSTTNAIFSPLVALKTNR